MTVQIVEMYRPGEMMANHAGTATTDGHFLRSGGQINISATTGGIELLANKYSVSFKKPESTAYTMNLYYGSSYNRDSALEWLIGDINEQTGTVCVATGTDTTYTFDSCNTLGYVNCDRLPTDSGATEMYLVLPTLNSYIENRIGAYNDSSHTFLFGDDGSQLPIGLDYKLIVVGSKNGKYYYGEKTGTTTAADIYVNIVLTEQSTTYVQSKINAF